MAIKQFESPETRATTFVNVTPEQKQPGQVHIFLFPNGEMIIEARTGECFHLEPSQVADLYVFFDSARVKRRMLDVLRKQLCTSKAGRKLITLIDKTLPFETAPLGAGQ